MFGFGFLSVCEVRLLFATEGACASVCVCVCLIVCGVILGLGNLCVVCCSLQRWVLVYPCVCGCFESKCVCVGVCVLLLVKHVGVCVLNIMKKFLTL